MFANLFTTLSLALLAASSPLTKRALTGPFDCQGAGAYTLCQNNWGASSGIGSQNTSLISASGNSIAWSTSYNWKNGPNNVKSYANVNANNAHGVQLSKLRSAPTSWSWSYQSQSGGLRADVSYDIWLGWSANGAPASSASSYEVMIRLSGQGGIQPVGFPIQSGISIAGHTWTLWSGPNSNWQVFSFVSANGNINNFNADLNDFFEFLEQQHGVSTAQFLQTVQAGTEPFTGSATLVTNNYSVSVSQ